LDNTRAETRSSREKTKRPKGGQNGAVEKDSLGEGKNRGELELIVKNEVYVGPASVFGKCEKTHKTEGEEGEVEDQES